MKQKHREIALHTLAAAMGAASLALGCYTAIALLVAVADRNAADVTAALMLSLGCIATAVTADDAKREIERSRHEDYLRKHAMIRAAADDAMQRNAAAVTIARRHCQIIREATAYADELKGCNNGNAGNA